MPSCMRVPPEAGPASTGKPSRVARSIASTSRWAAAVPIDPARNRNSQATMATRRPWMRPSPVTTASSTPDFSQAAARSAAYSSSMPAPGTMGSRSHDT